jgi:aspartyl-tRNA(Asn)/glutamyl-tRNA(Gln) amidotransferase subunit A
MTIRAIIFDYGSVLVRMKDETPRTQLAERYWVTLDVLYHTVFDSPTAISASVGDIPVTQHWDAVLAALNISSDERDGFLRQFWSADDLNRELVDFIRVQLRPHFKLGLLSNAWDDLRATLTERWGIVNDFDELIISAEVHVAKPNEAIYHLILERLGVAAEEAVFVDDVLANVEAARAIGIQAIQFTSNEALFADLNRLGVLLTQPADLAPSISDSQPADLAPSISDSQPVDLAPSVSDSQPADLQPSNPPPANIPLADLSLTAAAELLQQGEISAVELTRACLERIEQFNPQVNAFINVTSLLATQQAHQADAAAQRKRKTLSLRGIPVALKDLIHVAGVPTTCGSKHFAEYVPEDDAAVFERLRTAGTILLGKLNLHEVALGVTNENPYFGSVKNPWNLTHISGGSSGGGAAALILGMAYGALGTDTGGSIRIPASLCGVVGLKPTYGRVSVRGVMPLSYYLDHVGPMARRVKDVALLLKAMAGYDALDPYAVPLPVKDVLAHLEEGVQGWRVALADDRYFRDADAEILAALAEVERVFIRLGALVERVAFPGAREAAYANRLLTQADAAAIHRDRLLHHPDWFGADVLQRLNAGANTALSEYLQARRVQVEIRHQFETFFEHYDILLTPTTPVAAPRRGGDALERAKQLTRFTAPFNLTGLPALSVPCGFTQTGLPIGLQIVSKSWGEAIVLQAGFAYERATAWHTRTPLLLNQAG